VFLDAGKYRHDAQFRRQFVNRRPQLPGALVQRQAPRDSHQPGAKRGAVAEMPEVPIRPRERVLGDILRIRAMPQHAVRHPKREGERIGHRNLERALEVVGRVHEVPGPPFTVVVHSPSIAWRVCTMSRPRGDGTGSVEEQGAQS
jgi:hypothetical protein